MKSDFRERQAELVQLFHQAPICKTYGMKLHYEESGSAVFERTFTGVTADEVCTRM